MSRPDDKKQRQQRTPPRLSVGKELLPGLEPIDSPQALYATPSHRLRRPGVTKSAQALQTAQDAIRARDGRTALIALQPLLKARKPDANALVLAGAASELIHNIDAAEKYARQALKISDGHEALLLLARCHRMRGRTDDAVACCEKALAMKPGLEEAIALKGGALEEAGRFDDARAVIGPLIQDAEQQDAQAPLAVRQEWVKLLVQAKEYEKAANQIDELLEDQSVHPAAKCMLWYLKAKARDRCGEYGEAFDAATQANEIGQVEFSPELYEQQVSVLVENWSAEQMARFPVSKCRSDVPMFVAGMPRSGTSLIDQIIDAHPKAAGVGELASIEAFARQLAQTYDPSKDPPACFGHLQERAWTRVANKYVREITRLAPPGAQRIVNKALGNNKLVGLLARLFPETRIIHAIRDPRDVAVSCFMGGFNNRLHAWTTRIDWVARAWDQSMRMMEHWKQTLDVPILDVHYEKLVNDPDREFPRIIEFLGLDWDDHCMEFHKSRRTVRTLSYDQVNRPLYTSSAGRHKHYTRQIEGIEFPKY